MSVRTVRVKMNKSMAGTPVRHNPNKESIGTAKESLPFDFPAYLLIDRHIDKTEREDMPKINRIAGWTLTVDLYQFAMEIRVKISRKGVIVIEQWEQNDSCVPIGSPVELGKWTNRGKHFKAPPYTEPKVNASPQPVPPVGKRAGKSKVIMAKEVDLGKEFDDSDWE